MGEEGLEPGDAKDCSGGIFAAYRYCGLPVLRTRARNMVGENASGWHGDYVLFEDMKEFALVGMKIKKDAEFIDHIIITVSSVFQLAWAETWQMSTSKGAIFSTINKKTNNWSYRHAIVFKQL